MKLSRVCGFQEKKIDNFFYGIPTADEIKTDESSLEENINRHVKFYNTIIVKFKKTFERLEESKRLLMKVRQERHNFIRSSHQKSQSN